MLFDIVSTLTYNVALNLHQDHTTLNAVLLDKLEFDNLTI